MSVAAVVLGAGLSRRMGQGNKLLIPGADGRPMIAHTVDRVLASKARPVLVVVGHQATDLTRALAGRPVRFVFAPDYANGLAASLKAGIAAVPESCAGAIVCLGDMPLVSGIILDRLLDAYTADARHTIVVPCFQGKRGNPVLWDRRHFAEILALAGDVGARRLFASHAGEILEVAITDDAVLRDFDTEESLAEASKPF